MDSTPSLPRQSNSLEPGRKASERPRESNSPRSQDPPPTHNTSVHNLVPIIISGVDPKFKTTLLVTSELKQYHPSFNCTRVKLFKNGNILIVGDTPMDFAILQNESKMKAASDPDVKVSLPRAFHSEVTKFCQRYIDWYITTRIWKYADPKQNYLCKAERFISKRSSTPLPVFLVDLNEAATAEALTAKPSCSKIWHDFQGRGVWSPSLDQAMLPLSRFRTLGTELQKATCLLDMWRRSFP